MTTNNEKENVTYEDLFKNYKGDYKPHGEIITDSVGLERFWELEETETKE